MENVEDYFRKASVSAAKYKRKTKRTFCGLLKTIYQKIQSLLLIIVLIGYSFLGAFVFNFIEYPEELKWLEEERNKSIERRINATDELMNIYENCTIENNTRFCSQLFGEFIDMYEKELGVYEPHVKYPWNFWNSMLFSVTLFTTIGYGHMTTKTYYGRLATILYATLGIPLLLTFLNELGKLLFVKARRGWNILRRGVIDCIERCQKRGGDSKKLNRMMSKISIGTTDIQEVNFPLFLAIGVVFAYIFACSWIFCFWETEWDYFTAFYFFFISLSTIGLGDIVPDHPKFTLLGFAFFIIGLALVSFCINVLQAKVQLTYEEALAKLQNGLQYFDYDDSTPTSRSTSFKEARRGGHGRQLSSLTEKSERSEEPLAALGIIQIYGDYAPKHSPLPVPSDDEEGTTPTSILTKPDTAKIMPRESVKFKFERPQSLKIDKFRPASWASSVYETPVGGPPPN